MKKYRVYASQIVYHYKDVEAESLEDAEANAWEDENEWVEFDYGDWMLEDNTREVIA